MGFSWQYKKYYYCRYGKMLRVEKRKEGRLEEPGSSEETFKSMFFNLFYMWPLPVLLPSYTLLSYQLVP